MAKKAKGRERAKAPPGLGGKGAEPKLNWNIFNFLENLLVFCGQKTRSAPKESGVHFQISSEVKERGVCVLFKIDREHDPLMPARGLKPDYMVLFMGHEPSVPWDQRKEADARCIITIVEMKGVGEKDLRHGIEQIKALRDELHQQMAEHLPSAWRGKLTFQGILLTPVNSQIPLSEIDRERRNGLTIVPLQYSHKAELYPYVTKRNAPNERYQHRDLRRDQEEHNLLDKALLSALDKRIEDAFYRERSPLHRGRRGVFIDYANPSSPDKSYAALSAAPSSAVVSFRDQPFKDDVEKEMKRLRLPPPARLEFRVMDRE